MKTPRAPSGETTETVESATPPMERPSQQEWWLLRLLLENDEHVEWVEAHLELEWLANPAAREIVGRRLRAAGTWPGPAAWLGQLEEPAWQNLLTEILTDSRPIPDAAGVLKGSPTREGVIKILRDKHIERQLAAISRRLAAPDLDEAAQSELLTQAQHLHRLKQTPLSARSDQA
jgi:hypothetical protein